MIDRTQAIVLRVFPYSETSMVVNWLTPSDGRLTSLVKGGYRPRSPFLGQIDLFYTCEILYYHRPGRPLHILKECSPTAYRPRFRHDWRACATASYLADLVYRISPDQAHHGGLFEFLDGALDHLQLQGGSPAFLFWCEIQLLSLLGLSPRLSYCAPCRRPVAGTGSPAFFSLRHGGVQCAHCTSGDPRTDRPIAADVVGVLSAWQRSRSARSADSARLTTAQRTAIQQVLGDFVQYHLEIPQTARTAALGILAHTPGRPSRPGPASVGNPLSPARSDVRKVGPQ